MWKQTKEQVLAELEKAGRGYVAVDLDAARENMIRMHEHLEPDTKMMAVIKTDGYGHGAFPIGKALEDLEFVFGYAVATAEEALKLRKEGLEKPILILGYVFPCDYEILAKQNVRIAVFREDMLEELTAASKAIGKSIPVHIKVDTGMGRIGISPDDEGLRFVEKALHTEGVEIEGIFTHFARADETDKTNVEEQFTRFSDFLERIRKELGFVPPIRHCSNSAAILELPRTHLDMVRAGITLYGLEPSDEVDMSLVPLKPVMSLHSRITFVKTVQPGQSISYGGLFTAERPTRVATVPLGYGDGYPRSLTGKGEVLIRGKRCRILGRICMDQFMVDITDLPDVREGEPVVLMGRDGSECITAEELGAKSGRFNYELVCLISNRIPRICYLGGEPVYAVSYT
jgi:alanine racemase